MKKIMVIDDDPVWSTLCEGLLRSCGFDVEVAEDGEQALQALITHRPDLIVLDLHMRKMNGVEVLKHIRARLATVSTPVIAFSAASTTRLLERALNAGASRFVAKDHFDPDRFLEMIRATLSSPDGPASEEIGKRSPDQPPAREPQAAPLPARSVSLDMEGLKSLRAELRQKFLNDAPSFIGTMNVRLLGFLKSDADAGCRAFLVELGEGIGSMVLNAGMLGFGRIEQLAGVLELLIEELTVNREGIGASSLATIDHALELLGVLFENASQPGTETPVMGLTLVVNNDAAMRSLIGSAMELANLKWICMNDAQSALKALADNRVDLILLNSGAPGIGSSDIASAIRALPANHTTPVFSIADKASLGNPLQASKSGSNDLLAIPFLVSELAIKALTSVLKSQLSPG